MLSKKLATRRSLTVQQNAGLQFGFLLLVAAVCGCAAQKSLTLTVVHVNDIHAHFEEVNKQF